MTSVGVEDISVYCGRAVVDVADVMAGRGLDTSRVDNLMMSTKSVALPCEDPVTNAVNAAKPIIDRLSDEQRSRIELLAVGTESGLDLSKTLSNMVHWHLGLNRSCRVFEVKQACYAATAALRTATAVVATSTRPDARALVINADIPHPVQGSYYEPSQGVGSVAMLIGHAPVYLRFIPGAYGLYSFDVTDSCRPSFTREVVDTDVSLLAYIECLQGSFEDYLRNVGDTDVMRSFDHFAMHTPFGGMVKGAHRRLLRTYTGLTADQIEHDYRVRVEPSIRYGQSVGNIYSGSVLLALVSTLANTDHDVDRRLGVFSYGSGCASEFYSCVAPATAACRELKSVVEHDLASRFALTWPEYDELAATAGRPPAGTCDATVDIDRCMEILKHEDDGRPRLVLTGVSDYRRQYAWTIGGGVG